MCAPFACPKYATQNRVRNRPMTTTIHILIIDMDAETLKACKEILSSRKATTVATCDSRAAMRQFGTCNPDIVLTEMVMPERDGIEVLREIKRAAPQTKVIAMSGGGASLPTEFVLHVARRLGADGTVSKPVDATRLLEAIDKVLSDSS
jgi:DNA-binding NtrC family response regulator